MEQKLAVSSTTISDQGLIIWYHGDQVSFYLLSEADPLKTPSFGELVMAAVEIQNNFRVTSLVQYGIKTGLSLGYDV